MTFLAHIADKALNCPLLITPEKASVIIGVLSGRIGVAEPGASRFEGDFTVRRNANGEPIAFEPFKVANGVGIITVTGSLVNRGAWVGASSGLTSYEGIQHQLKRAAASTDVKTIVLDLHSPGGEAVGAFETAALVREVAKSKPVTAIVNGLAASAAYAIASGATGIVTTPSGISGSIGVVWLHADFSRQLENDGVKPTFIYAGKHKVDGHPFGPLPDEVRSDIQAQIDAVYDQFVKTVAAGRGQRMTAAMARATEARVITGQAAVDAGLADRLGTFESVLADLTRGSGRSTSQKGKSMSENQGAPAAETSAGLTKADLDAAVAKAATDATTAATANFDAKLKADRERMAALDELAAECAGNAEGAKIIAAAKADGSSAADTSLKLVRAGVFKKAAVLGAIQQDDMSATGAAPAAPGSDNPTAAQSPEGWKAEWEKSDKLKGEFATAELYAGYMKAQAAGRVRLATGKAA